MGERSGEVLLIEATRTHAAWTDRHDAEKGASTAFMARNGVVVAMALLSGNVLAQDYPTKPCAST
jgi:hypothetical protein